MDTVSTRSFEIWIILYFPTDHEQTQLIKWIVYKAHDMVCMYVHVCLHLCVCVCVFVNT